jgi:hypothetical protein
MTQSKPLQQSYDVQTAAILSWAVDDHRRRRVEAMQSLCETCASMREIVTPKGSRFLLCQLSQTDPAFPKYPPQPVARCDGYQPRDSKEQETKPRE